MLDCVVLTVDNGKRKLLQRRKIQYKWLALEQTGCDVIILPYSNDEIYRMSEKKFFKMMSRIYNDLDGKLICAYRNSRLDEFIRSYGLKVPSGTAVMADIIDTLVKKCAKNNGINLKEDVIGVYDCGCSDITYNILFNLSRVCSNLSLFTENISKAQRYLDSIFDETGLSVMFSDNLSDWIKGKKLICLVGKCADDIQSDNVIIDVCGENSFGIKNIFFDVPDKYDELFYMTNRNKCQDMVDFLLILGEKIEVGKNVRIIGYK